MRVIKAGYDFITPIDGKTILKRLEEIGRVCYKSEDKITEDSYAAFIQKIVDRGHEAMIEHCAFTVKFTCDRGISHEIVRHRVASYAQESTRYCNYAGDKFGNEITFIIPCWFDEIVTNNFLGDYTFRDFVEDTEKDCLADTPEVEWVGAMLNAEKSYNYLIKQDWKPEQARSVLPNSLKTEIVVTMNLREWRHFFTLRTAKTAHPQMREITRPLLEELKTLIPIIFDDITWEEHHAI